MKKLSYVLLSGIILSACTQTVEIKENANDQPKESVESNVEVKETVIEEDSKLSIVNFEDYAKLDTREKVVAHFGAENIVNGTSWYGEGSMSYPHSIVTNKENGHVVKYLWQEADSNKINFLEATHKSYNENYEVTGTQSLASTSGLKLGMPIKELLAWNDNKEIKFSGFAWDFHGMVHQGDNSTKLGNCGLSITMDDNMQEGLSADFMGDVTLSTNDEAVLSAPIIVGQFTYHLPE